MLQSGEGFQIHSWNLLDVSQLAKLGGGQSFTEPPVRSKVALVPQKLKAKVF